MLRSYLRTPGRGGVGQAAPVRDLPGPGPSGGCALCASVEETSVPGFEGAKCRTEKRQCYARVGSPPGTSVLCGESAALRSSAAGSFRVFAPLPPQAPSEEQSPSTPRYAYGVFIPGRYSITPPPGRIPPEVCRAPRGQAFRLLAQTLSVWSTAAPFPKPPKTAPVGQCLGFAHERSTSDSADGPSRPRPRRPSAHPRRRSLSGSGSL